MIIPETLEHRLQVSSMVVHRYNQITHCSVHTHPCLTPIEVPMRGILQIKLRKFYVLMNVSEVVNQLSSLEISICIYEYIFPLLFVPREKFIFSFSFF